MLTQDVEKALRGINIYDPSPEAYKNILKGVRTASLNCYVFEVSSYNPNAPIPFNMSSLDGPCAVCASIMCLTLVKTHAANFRRQPGDASIAAPENDRLW